MLTRNLSEPVTILRLRVVTQRLTATPAWKLPQIAPYLAGLIVSCEGVFTTLEIQPQGKDGSEAVVLIHKLKTQVSALLHDKSPQSRWAAIILIKAIIEIGGWNVLQACDVWVRGLLSILGKPEPQTTKQICIITLTRLFVLLSDHQSLVREILTPSLPGFIASCTRIMEDQKSLTNGSKTIGSDLVATVLNAFCELLPHHSTLFRPFVAPIRALILPFVASTPSNQEPEGLADDQQVGNLLSLETTAEPSRRLYVLLSSCASKNTSGEEWAKSLHTTIVMMHCTADRIFRAVAEDGDSASFRVERSKRLVLSSAETVSDLEENPLGLPGWQGIHAGMERLDGLLHILQQYLTNKIAMPVAFPTGSVFDVLTRILSVFPPSGDRNDGFNGDIQINPEIGRDEREGLWATLPNLHITALEVLSLMVSRFGKACAALYQSVLEQVLWVFEREKVYDGVRKLVYEIISKILALFGFSLSNSISPLLSKCIRSCCEDLLPTKANSISDSVNSTSSSKTPLKSGATMNADSYLKKSSNIATLSPIMLSEAQKSAATLLPLTISNLPCGFIHSSVRTQIERTAILTNDKQAMVASILNPQGGAGVKSSSIMPLLARQFPSSMEAEALIRPRMPILRPRRAYPGDLSFVEEENEIAELGETTAEYNSTTEPTEPVPSRIAQPPKNDTIPKSNTSPPPTTQPSPPALEPPQTQPLTPSRKRDRDPSSPHPDPSHPHPAPPASPLEDTNPPWHKRPRIDDPSTGDAQSSITPTLSGYVNFEDLGRESDESEFEMPVLDPTLDTDDEEEESGGEEGKEEEKEEGKEEEKDEQGSKNE